MKTREEIIQEAGEKASSYKLSGYHCSESVIRALNDTFGWKMSKEMLRMASGFRGGGGGIRGRCGIIEAGIMAISYLYGRDDQSGTVWTYSYLTRYWIQRFEEHFGSSGCLDIYTKQKAMQVPNTCHDPVVEGTKIIAEILYDAEEILRKVPEEERR